MAQTPTDLIRRFLRDTVGMTLPERVRASGVSRQTMAHWVEVLGEDGEGVGEEPREPRAQTLEKLRAYFDKGVPIGGFLDALQRVRLAIDEIEHDFRLAHP